MKGFIVNKTLSATQIQTALKNKKQYIEMYFNDMPSFTSPYTDFGNLVHDNVSELGMNNIPTDWEAGKRFFVEKENYNLMGYTDLENDTNIIEIKTCTKFDKKKYQFQCDFYRYCTGKPVQLVMLKTAKDGTGLFLTGEEEVHDIVYSGDEAVEQKINEAIKKIHEYYEEYTKLKND